MAKTSDETFDIPDNVKKITDGNLEFAFQIYNEAVKKDLRNETNLVLSPLSVAFSLGILYHGAANKTAEELKKALKLDKIEKGEDIYSGFQFILQSINKSKIKGSKLMEFKLTNCLHLDAAFKLSTDYELILRNYYQAQINRINVSKAKTESLPEGNSLDTLPVVSSQLSLLNAISFKCKWYVQFDKTQSRGLFQKSPSSKVVTNYMHVKSEFYFVEKNRPSCKFLELPYAGSGYKMYVILPKDIHGLSAIENMMTRGIFRGLKSSGNKVKVDVSIPKFKLNTNLILNKSLKGLGVNDLLSMEKADLTLMADDRPLYLSSFVHKASVEIDEEGVNASGSMHAQGHKNPRKLIEFKADHPFMFIIYDQRRDFILFVGRLTDPNQ